MNTEANLLRGQRCAALIINLAIMLCGCVAYRAAPLDPHASAERFAARRLEEPAVRNAIEYWLPQFTAAWPPPRWDRATLLAVALAQSPQLAVARAQTRFVESQELLADQPLNPDLKLQSEYARREAHPWLYGLSTSWIVRSGQVRSVQRQAARLATDGSRLQSMNQAWAVRQALADALSMRESARRRLALLDQLSSLQEQLIDGQRQRIAAGEDAPGEVLLLQQGRTEIQQQQAETRALAAAAEAAAAKALGLPVQALEGLQFDWPDWGDPPPVVEDRWNQVREQALLARADLDVAIQEYAATELRLRHAILRQYPQFEFSPGYYWDHGIAKLPFDVSFAVPFNRLRGEIATANADREVSAQRMLALQADIFGDIDAASHAESEARNSLDVARQQMQYALHAQRVIETRLRVGDADLQERLTAQVLIARAELQMLERRAQLQHSRNALEDALHSPLSGPELALARAWSASTAGAGL
jgi:outer membrane protein TolC